MQSNWITICIHFHLQRTYGKWWDMAPSRITDIMPQTINENMPQDFIGNKILVMININIDSLTFKLIVILKYAFSG